MLNKTTPYWPQENGLVERQNRCLLKRLKIIQAQNRDWEKDLEAYLSMYYQSLTETPKIGSNLKHVSRKLQNYAAILTEKM